jgi:class 3 adenylate cyclase
MDYVSIASDERTINLSRANNTLFEFLLPQESVLQERPVINHVVIKADVRGSTEITKQMVERGLNPASYFSLNFFDPITEILSEYGASKVFIEGDAVILSITEHEQTPKGWYAVARACGLASKMLAIVNRCNSNCGKNNLPKLELGIGITFNNNPPTYLFDENNKIMISPAINQADRLSSCAKSLRRKMGSRKPFNLYVFQAQRDRSPLSEGEEVYLRFNVNGIELSPEAFNKLNREIEMRRIEAVFPDVAKEKINIYIGKFPTAGGKIKKLVVREAPILEIPTGECGGLKKTSKTYYEVVSNPRVIEYVEKLI